MSAERARASAGRIRSEQILTSTILLAVSLALTGCNLDDLMSVEFPGQLIDSDLTNPLLAPTLVVSAQNEFECAFASYVWVTGLWAAEWRYGQANFVEVPIETRARRINELGQQTCPGSGWYLPMQRARVMAAEAVRRIEAVESAAVPNRDLLLARARAYEGYAHLKLGEAMCAVAIDGQLPHKTREETWRIAIERFATAMTHAGRASGAAAEQITNFARVGTARAALNLGDGATVLANAELVPNGFVYNAVFEQTPTARRNPFIDRNVRNGALTVHDDFLELNVNGVRDPRVAVVQDGVTFVGNLPMYVQKKFAAWNTPIPIASWREAQLMIAEIRGGQAAVDIINRLRGTHNLPQFSSSDPAAIRAQVIEERRRELWMQGHRMGDKLRYQETWETGLTPTGRPYGDETCWPVPIIEVGGEG